MARKSVSHNVNLGDHFLVRQEELSELMKLREEKVKDEVDRKYGGVLDLCEKLQSSSKDGIVDDPAELNSRQTAFGRNVIPTKKPKTLFQLAWKAMKDPMLIILQVAAAVSIGFAIWTILTKRSTPNVSPTSMSQINTTSSDGTIISETRVTSEALAGSEEDHGSEYEWIEGVAILVAVIVIVLVSAFNDYGKEKQFQALQNQVKREHQVNVIRGGVQKQVLTDDLVVGDVCMLKYGDVVPADGVLLHSQDLSIDESSLTGESDHVKKGPERDISILSGTHVMEGSGRMLVVAVGLSSQTGIVYKLMLGASKEEKKELKKAAEEKRKAEAAKTTERDDPDDDDEEEEDDDQSVLQKKLTLIAKNIGYIGLAFALATTIIIIVRFCYKRYVVEKQEWKTPDDIISIVDAIIIGITILVVAIPEGLPLAVTLTLAVSAKKMMKDHNLVRHLFACETMGCATTICSDKTGTLTTNRMTVMKSFLGDKTCTPVPPKDSFAERMLKLVALGISVNSSYTSQVKPSAGGGPPDQVGNKTECALLQLVNTMEYDYAKIRKDHPEDSFAKVYTFNSNRKSMSTVLSTDRGWRILSKGGAEIIMDKCDYILNANGAPELFTDEKKQDIMDTVVTQMASEGLRTICVAYKDILTSSENPQINEQILDGRPNFQEEKQIVSGLTCLAIFGIEDPVRPEVPAAIAQCRKAGVTVRMVTGDNVATARSIALKCGIISAVEEAKGNAVLEGEEFNRKIRGSNGKVDQKLFDVLYPKLRVLARSTPQDKFTLVEGIINTRASKHREVVAVTGDGTNDAPALKKADVGFAMGIAGTDVAKEASDIILTDDNFNSIVKACMWGRNIYDNICKFLQFQLTVNFSALILTVTASAYLSNTPLKAVPMLWLNLIQDTLASLALSTEPPSDHLLNRKPYGRKSRIVSGLMFRNIVGTGVYQLMVLFLIIFGRDKGILDFLHPEGKPTNTENDTLVFNIFVFMTIFNLINARRIDNGRNVFARFFKNPVFTGILLLMAGTQAVVVNFGGRAFSSSPLNWQEWIACIVMGAGGLIWYQLLVFLPTRGVFSKFSKVKGSEPGERERSSRYFGS